MTDKPKVSVIIPVYNAESTVHRCLDCFMSQTLTGWELILVDDGSLDRSGRICDEYAANCVSRSNAKCEIRVIHRKNGGVSAARQTGLECALGEYVIHADPDDWVEPTMLEDLYLKAKAEDADMVICDFFTEIEGKTIYRMQKPTSAFHFDVLNDLFGPKVHGSCWNKLVKRDCIIKYAVYFPIEIYFCEDMCFNVQLLKNDIKIAYIPKAYYHYVQGSTSITNNYTRKTFENHKRFVDFLATKLPPDSDAMNRSKLLVKKLAFRNALLDKKEFKTLYPEIKKTDDKNFLMRCMYYSAFRGYHALAKGCLLMYNLLHKVRR